MPISTAAVKQNSLEQDGLSPEDIVRIFGENNGSNSQALQLLMAPVLYEDDMRQADTPMQNSLCAGSLLEEAIGTDLEQNSEANNTVSGNNEHPQTNFQLLLDEGFENGDIASVLEYGDGYNNIQALIGLTATAHDEDGDIVHDNSGQPLTYMGLLLNTGFIYDDVIRILTHLGGPINLTALLALLRRARDSTGKIAVRNDGQPQTILNTLLNVGLSIDDIISVLNNDRGHRNLEALKGLLMTAKDWDNNNVCDNLTQPQTFLRLLQNEDFSLPNIVSVLSYSGGYIALRQLFSLLDPAEDGDDNIILTDDGEPISGLKMLLDAGFKIDLIIRILSHNNGYKNLRSLVLLFDWDRDQDNTIRLDDRRQPRTIIQALSDAGFSPDNIGEILDNDSGCKNMTYFLMLITKINMRTFFMESRDNRRAVISLTNAPNRSDHLSKLTECLATEPCLDYLRMNHGSLTRLCELLRSKSVEELRDQNVDSLMTAVASKICNSSRGKRRSFFQELPDTTARRRLSAKRSPENTGLEP